MRREGRRPRKFRGYGDDYARRAGHGYGREAGRWSGTPRSAGFGDAGTPRSAGYGDAYRTPYRERGGRGRFPENRPRRSREDSRSIWGGPLHRPARGFPAHAVHTYDLDYGRQAGGPTTEYSGRVGYPVPVERAADRGDWYGEPWRREGAYRAARRDLRMNRRTPLAPPRHWSTAEPRRRGYRW